MESGTRRAEARRQIERSLAPAVALSALAVSQPLLELFGQNPTFFVARDAGTTGIVLFGAAVAIGPSLLAIGVVALAAVVSGRLAAAAHHVVVVALAGLAASTLLVHAGGSGPLVAIGALAVGVLVAMGLEHVDGLRSATECLTPLPMLILALFLFLSPTSRLLWSPAASAQPAQHVDRPADVALLVFDELPLASLLRADGTIDEQRFPHFAELARHGTWYRNATTSYPRTELAVPSLLSGSRPEPGAIPSVVDHPQNLFTLLSATYRMNVVEEVTDLCPDDVCGGTEAAPSGDTVAALRDAAVVYGHQAIPDPWASRLPVVTRSWGGFHDAEHAEDPFDRRRDDPPGTQTQVGKVAFADRMIEGIHRGTAPSLNVAHVVFPHSPWTLTPQGQEYNATLEGLHWDPKSRWEPGPTYVRRGQAMHLLQLGYADAVLGRLIDRLRAEGMWHDALVAVVADHGAAFRAGDFLREPSGRNEQELYRVPFLLKAPGQTRGVVDDRPAQLVDLVPTIADELGVATSWRFDGVALHPDGDRPDPLVVLPAARGPQPFTRSVDPLLALARRNARRFPHGDGWSALFAVGEDGGRVGRPAEELPRAPAGAPTWRWSSEAAAAYDEVDPDGAFLPIQLVGTLEGAPGQAPPDHVLVAVDGVVAGVGDGLSERSPGRWRFVALLDPARFAPGRARLDVYVPVGDREPAFAPAAPADAAAARLGAGDDGTPTVLHLGSRRLPVEGPGERRRLEIARAFSDGVSVVIDGLSVEDGTERPSEVLAFVGGRPASLGANPYPVLNQGGEELDRWGFELLIPHEALGGEDEGWVVAVYPDHALAVAVDWG